MVTVELNNLILQGHHGVYEEERKLANTFEVNLSVAFDEKKAVLQNLPDTIDYEELYAIIKQKMSKPGFLLEKICQDIIHTIKKQYSFIKEINISIYKIQVPIENFQGRAGVSIHKKFKK